MKKIFYFCLFLVLTVFSVSAESSGCEFGIFSTTDVNGNPVSQEIFSEKDVTVVNVWGTFCGPCIGEMPELGEWEKSFPQNVQLIGIVIDVSSKKDKKGIAAVKKIMKRSGAEFKNILASDSIKYLETIQFVPTTLLVDKNGNIIGEPVVGADLNGYKEALETFLNGKN